MVAEQAKKVPNSVVYVATDDARIFNVVVEAGHEAVLTSGECRNGTERVAEAARKLKLNGDDVVINLQGDMPFIQPMIIEQVMRQSLASITTAACVVKGSPPEDQSHVKVVFDRNLDVLYFSRLPIPTFGGVWHKHIGIYGFRNEILQYYSMLPITLLEQQEDLEQLRILHYGKHAIKIILTDSDCLSINNQTDYKKAINWPREQITGHFA